MSLLAKKAAMFASGSVRDPDAVALIERMTVKPGITRQLLIDKTIRDLKAVGFWDTLDCFYMLAAHDEQAALLNWKQNAFNAARVGSAAAFTPDVGWRASNVNYVNSTFTPSTATGAKYTRLSAHIALWGLSASTDVNTGGGGQSMGVGSASSTQLTFINLGGGARATVNRNTNVAAPGAELGEQYVQARGLSDRVTARHNGSAEAQAAMASPVLPTAPIWIGRRNATDTGSDGRLIRHASIGSGLYAGSLYPIIRNYMRRVGVDV